MNTLFFQQNHELFQAAKAQLHASITEHVATSNTLNQNMQAELCCMAIDTILANLADYDTVGYIPPSVQEHTVDMLKNITQADALFGLLEDLALITRSHTLFAHQCNDAEQKFLQAFENIGECTQDNGTIVSDWYWYRLPVLAMSQYKKFIF